MASLSELETEVAEEIGSINTTDDQTKIRRFLNRAVRDFLRRTRCYVESETLTPGASANWALPSSVLAIVDLYWTGATHPLDPVPVAEIHRRRRAGATGGTGGFPRVYAFQNPLVLFEFAPGANDTVTVVDVPAPTAMSDGAHDPSNATYGGIPEDYHDALALYAEWKLASFDDDSSSAQGQRYRDLYLERTRDCRRELAGKAGQRLPRANAGRRRPVAHNPSTDLGW